MDRPKEEARRTEVAESARFATYLEKFSSVRALVVGDLLLDEYRSGDVDRISPEAPVPVVRVASERSALGGAGNVARGLAALGAACDLVATAGTDTEGDRVLALMAESGLSTTGVVRSATRATPHKIRVVARGQQMLRIDREDDGPLDPRDAEELRRAVTAILPKSDVVILQDYDKGIFSAGLASWIIERARVAQIPVVVDPKHDLRRFQGASIVKPNIDEALAFVPGTVSHFSGRRALLEKIQHELGGAEIVLTRGADGMTALDNEGQASDVPTRRAEVFDVQGAGDTSIAALALCRAVGADLVDSCIVANAAAAVAVGKRGTAAVERSELVRELPAVLDASDATEN